MDSLLEVSSPGEEHHVKSTRKLVIACVICLVFMIGELVGGILANSLAIMSDAAHMFSDLTAFAIALCSIHFTKKAASNRLTYGYKRAEVMGALLSVALIWVLTVWLIWNAILRVISPEYVEGHIMLIVGVGGLLCNIVMAFTLHHDHNHTHGPNVNMRAAFLHVLGDLLQSVGVVVAAIIIFFREDWRIADPICTFLFSVIVVFTTGPVAKECVIILMQGVPSGIKVDAIRSALSKVRNYIG